MNACKPLLLTLAAALFLAACGSNKYQSWDSDQFAQGNYRYYAWRSEPLPTDSGVQDEMYRLDPVVRPVIDQILQDKGYVLAPEKAQFNIDYLYAPGLQIGVASDEASNLYTHPGVVINRMPDGASVDNAHALAGVHETRSLALQINDVAATREVWRSIVTEISDGIPAGNDPDKLRRHLEHILHRAMRDLPKVAN